MKKTLLLLVALITATIAFAKTEIDGIYYNLNDETKTAEVTYQYQYRDGDNYSGVTSITIPEKVTYNSTEYSVTSIGYAAFYECTSLTSITIPNNVTSIGEYAFYDCDALTSISIPNSVTSIENVAFYGTPWLNNQPDGCLYIGKCLHQYKGEMPENTHINVKEGTTMICGAAFYECTSLTSITIPNSVTSIGSWAFEDCSSLTSITIPNSVTSIGDRAFRSTAWLNNQPDGCLYIGKCLYQYKGEMPENTHIDVKEGTTMICDGAFEDCSSLTSISIPNSVTSIGSWAFSGCSSLTSITIPNSVTAIGLYAFQYCNSLTSITIPNSVTSIGNWAFSSCSSLTSITCLGSTPPEASDLGAYTSICTLIVPKVAYSSYLRHTYWGQFLNIETIDVDYKKLTTIANNDAWGVVEGGGYYDNGDEATLTATANLGYRFVKWSDEVTDNPRTVVVTQDSTFTAIFEANSFAITTAVNDDAMGSVTEGGEYTYGTEITLTATPNDGYRFTQWSDGNTDNPRIITVTENKTYTAEFKVAEATNVETSKISSANIYTTNGTLHIEGATDDYHILDAAGRLIYSGNATTLTLPRGIYLVTINGEVEKIVL